MNIMQRYDQLRSRIPLVPKPDMLVLTSGICGKFNDSEVADIMENVRSFNQFKESNDPWHEHDFGSFVYQGNKIFWKIDDFKGHDGYELVLTVMLAEEY